MRVTLRRSEAIGLVFLAGGCDPILNIQGSFFPAWIVCLVVGVSLAFVLRYVFAATRLAGNHASMYGAVDFANEDAKALLQRALP